MKPTTVEQKRAAKRAYYLKHRDATGAHNRARSKAHRLAHPEKVRAYHRAYYKSRTEKFRAYSAARLARGQSAFTPTRPCPEFCEIGGMAHAQKQALCLDHDHTTGKFRGWLCSPCNLMLGSARDSADTLLGAALYLERAS
jgi:Recombination endonuclease VII